MYSYNDTREHSALSGTLLQHVQRERRGIPLFVHLLPPFQSLHHLLSEPVVLYLYVAVVVVVGYSYTLWNTFMNK